MQNSGPPRDRFGVVRYANFSVRSERAAIDKFDVWSRRARAACMRNRHSDLGGHGVRDDECAGLHAAWRAS